MPAPALMTVAAFAAAVAAFRDMTSCSVTSWGRTPRRNALVGGVTHSRHLVDLAVDVVYDVKLALDVVRDFAHTVGLSLRREEDHDHLEPLDQGA